MIPRVGVDLVPLSRVEDILRSATPHLHRLLSDTEISLSRNDSGFDHAGIAGRLAAKEAVFKVLHTERETLPWLGVEILRGRGGWPEVQLSGRARRLAHQARLDTIAVSITHDGPFAVAVVVAHITSAPQGR
ncbi:holo-ACP synthase [Solihabitans fulvus]|uniref:Holo-[acyl-carrier-protein] synthase n=1 Tax=Solihabitans fulvus TaxID=1892852 RepID=A0A5B2WXE3_9PSEU|nr:holo-ACP synthase [Solihabitans fulvus]KAA2255352.1 holo-ACP synthase [Solihabitans fulvus]